MAHMTRFRARKCLLGVRKFILNIYLIFRKNEKNYNYVQMSLDARVARFSDICLQQTSFNKSSRQTAARELRPDDIVLRTCDKTYPTFVHAKIQRPNLQNFVKWTFVILSQFFRTSFVCQLIRYRTKSLRKICERITTANFSDQRVTRE